MMKVNVVLLSIFYLHTETETSFLIPALKNKYIKKRKEYKSVTVIHFFCKGNMNFLVLDLLDICKVLVYK